MTPPSPELYEDHLHPSRKGILATSNILELNSLCSKLTVTAHTCTPIVRFDIILISQPTSNNLKDRIILTRDKRVLSLILHFSPLVDSLPPIYPYTLEVLCFQLTILPWQFRTYTLTGSTTTTNHQSNWGDITSHAPLAGDLSPGPVGERWREKRCKLYVCICADTRVCMRIFSCRWILWILRFLPWYYYRNTVTLLCILC